MNYKQKLNKLTTFIFDVDGVLTNGLIYLLEGQIARAINSRDGYAIQYAVKMGYQIFVITGGASQEVKKVLLDVGVKEVHLQASNKLEVYNNIKERHQLNDEEILYMGDDIPDYEVLKTVGVATCPQDADVTIKSICDYQSPYNGGQHCVRDVIEQTLRVQDKWFKEEAFHW